MSRIFNVSADCQPNLHYMVDITDRLSKIKKMIDAGQYFTINRARQYGKTTTLRALEQYLQRDYYVVSLDFQFLTHEAFRNEASFAAAFAKRFLKAAENITPAPVKDELRRSEPAISRRRRTTVFSSIFEAHYQRYGKLLH